MSRLRSETHTTVESPTTTTRRPSLWAGSLRRDHIRLEDLTQNRIQEEQPYMSSRSGPSTSSRHSFAWPFHGRNASEVPSTPRSSRLTFRNVAWQPRTFFRPHDDTASIDRSIVPDYVVNFIRGETPETLARKKEERKWGQRDVVVTPRRETHASHPLEFGGFYNSASDVTRGANTYSSWSRRSGLRRHVSGWRGGVIFNSMIAFFVLVVGIICLILAITETRLLAGESAVFVGGCLEAERVNIGIHVVINACGVAILAGANYVFQVLSSPTRSEVTVAHGNKRWLDIGIPSVRNFMHISGFRTAVAVVLLLSAVATQVIYNAVIFTSRNAVAYNVLFVTPSFFSGAPFASDAETNAAGLPAADIAALQDSSQLTTMSVAACVREFGGLFVADFDTVLLVAESSSSSSSSSLLRTGEPGTPLTAFLSPDSANDNERNLAEPPRLASPDGPPVLRCLARPAPPPTCSVNLSGSMLGVAVLLNLAAVISMAVVLARSTFEPLATLGDALRSFLRHPDPVTANDCLLAKADVRRGHLGPSRGARYFAPADHFWFQTPSAARWALLLFAWLAAAAPAAVGLALLLRDRVARAAADPAAWSLYDVLTRFGAAVPYATFPLRGTAAAPAAASFSPADTAQVALLAAAPQLLLAALYLVANAHLTAYFLSRESAQFALGARALRVSAAPAGAQCTSLYLTLPRPASWALVAWFGALGFVLSQAVFPGVAAVHAVSALPALPTTLPPAAPAAADDPLFPRPLRTVVAVAASTQGLLALLALLAALLLAVLALGCVRTPAASLASGEARGNPLALPGGSCSAVISARCHHHEIDQPAPAPVPGNNNTAATAAGPPARRPSRPVLPRRPTGADFRTLLYQQRRGDVPDIGEEEAGETAEAGAAAAGAAAPEAGDQDNRQLWLRPIAWGVVEEGSGMRPGRCGFSANGVGCVDVGRNYI
ncbi:hypothetical protein GGS23DRAFT_614232 [Durotheca rogersii]|uniref:uncharacterized protein n=1 Tax=Durotheca rogersii TaxID=419775 RepID=UPI00221EC9A2|nr:uncharacterized protein GGS23DRAFT_614232 [Durotheca rogersii]KAI5860076.1 hypothetical protein GGS23DRAFT_614232 [Durotheca rogersii]